MSETIVIATRESPLALWQAEHVKSRLEAAHKGIQVSLLGMTSRGDQLLDKPLFKVGGSLHQPPLRIQRIRLARFWIQRA